MNRQILCLLTCLFLLAFFISPAELLAAPYYEGKILTIVVGYGPGGAYDIVARLVAKHLPKYIPGKPNIIIQNMPGGGSLIAADYLYQQAKPDGLTIGCFARAMPFYQLMKVQGVKFDLRKFSWIGSPIIQSAALCIRSDLPYKTFDDLLKAKEVINFGVMGVGGSDTQFLGPLKEFLGLKANLIAYPGSPEIYLAIERKELDGEALTYSGAKPYIERGLVRPLLRGLASEPGIENLPVNINYTSDKKAKTLMSVVSVIDKVGQAYVAPPKTPDDMMNIIRQAFTKWTQDPEVQGEGKKLALTIRYVSAEESLEVVNYVLNQPPEIVSEIGKYVK